MSNKERVPGERGESTTTLGVAALVDALALPSIEPLGTDISALSELPELPVPGESGPASWSQLDAVRALMDSCGEAVAALRRHQNRCAAQVAVMVERMEATAVLEGKLLSLDWWQRGCAIDQIQAELAVLLQVTEGVAGRLIDQSVTLVRLLPSTMENLSAGELGWDYAVVIAEETSLLRASGVSQEAIDIFEQQLLKHAENKTLSSFKSAARRVRERSHPESIAARTRRSYADRNMRVSRGADGMSWMSLYAPSPTIEAIWDQCTYTAQAAQGPHEDRTLTQLRADICAALLLRQSMAENSIHSPAATEGEEAFPGFAAGGPAPAGNGEDGPSSAAPAGDASPAGGAAADETARRGGASPTSNGVDAAGAGSGAEGAEAGVQAAGTWWADSRTYEHTAPKVQNVGNEPKSCWGAAGAEPGCADSLPPSWQIPVFDDPDYGAPGFMEPDPRNHPDWRPAAQLPVLIPAGKPGEGSGQTDAKAGDAESGPAGGIARTMRAAAGGNGSPAPDLWPPLPQVTPVVLIPALSLLGETNEPAWMAGAGPISMEVAKRMVAQSGSFLRVLVDPFSNRPLDRAPDRYRIDQAMRTMLLIRDEYCEFPGCTAKAVNCDVDHIKSFETGGRSIYDNLEHLCAHHHLVKHYKDDKNRSGRSRCMDEPERQGLRLRGWSPHRESDGRISWTSPAGRYCPPQARDEQAPVYPEWLKNVIDATLSRGGRGPDGENLEAQAPENPARGVLGGPGSFASLPTGRVEAGSPEWNVEAGLSEAWEESGELAVDAVPEFGGEDDAILTQLAIRRALKRPWLGGAAAA